MASGLSKLKSSLKDNTSDIKKDIKALKGAFITKKGKNFATIIKDAAKPLGTMAKDFKSMAKSVPPISKGVKNIAKYIQSLSKGGKKGGAIAKVAKDFDTLQKHLYKDRGSIKKSLSSISSALSGKKGFVHYVNSANSSIKKLKGTFSSLASNTKSFASNLKTAASAIKTLASKKSSLDNLSSSIKGLYKAVNNYKFGSKIKSQAKTAASALSGKSSFASKFKSAAKSVKGTEASVAHTFKTLKSSVVSSFKSMWSQVKSNTNNNLKDIVSGINDAVDDINDAIDSMDHAGKHHKTHHAHSVHLANGTGPISKATLGILNDGTDAPEIQNREGLLHPNGMLEFLAGVNVPRLLLPGDQVIKSSDMSKLLGIRHFAGGTANIPAVSGSKLNRIIQIAQSMLKSVRSISSKISKLSKSSNDSTVHDASYSSSSSSSSKKRSGKSTKSMVPFSRLGFFGNLKNVVRGIIKSGSGEQVYLSQSTRRSLGYKNAKGSATVKASKSLLNRITKFYEKRKRENAKILAEQRKQRANARKREEKKQRLLKREMDIVDAKYNARRKEAVLKKEEAAAKRKARAAKKKTTRKKVTKSATASSTSSKDTSANVSVSVSGASAIDSLLKKIKGNHKLKIKASLSGGKSVKSMVSSILGKVNSSRSKRTMLIRIKHSGVHDTKTVLSQILKKVNSSRSKRTILIHVKHDGVHDTKKLLKEVIHEVAKLKKGKKNELTVHVKHDGVHDTKKALESVASTGKKMWKELESSARSGISKLKSQFRSFSSYYKKGWSSLGSGIRGTMKHAWSEMKSDAKKGLNKVIDVLNSAIGKINGVVKSFGGKKVASKARHLATGTGYLGSGQRRAITKPTLAILNDGHDSPETQNKEVVWTPWNNRFDVVPGQNTKAMLLPGQEVFNATESKELGFTHFATGTGALKQLYELAKKNWTHPIKTAENMFGDIKGLIGAINSLAHGMKDRGEGQVKDWWSQLWKMVEAKVNDGDIDATGLLKAVEKYGKGHKYVWGAAGPDEFDCSGLVMYALEHAYGIKYPHYSGAQYAQTDHISKSQAKMGDLVFWGKGGSEHVGVYAGGNRYFSAESPEQGIHMNTLDSVVGYGKPLFGRVRGLNQDKDSEPKVKTNNRLQKMIRIR